MKRKTKDEQLFNPDEMRVRVERLRREVKLPHQIKAVMAGRMKDDLHDVKARFEGLEASLK